MKNINFLILFIILFAACENDLEQIQELDAHEFVNKEWTKNVELIYSDSAIVRTIIRADEMINYSETELKQEFPKGIKVEFFNERQRINSTLTANYAIRYENRKEIVVQDDVVWKSSKPETLETEELIWDEKNAKVRSNRFVKITTPDDVFYGYGLEANEDFSWWRIEVPQGEMGVEEF